MFEYLEKLVSFYPVTDNQASVGELLNFLGAFFTAKGFEVERFEYNGVKSMVASVAPTKTPALLLQAHVDVVPGKDQPFRQEKDRFYGRGVFDMLFGTAAFMQLVDDLDPVAKGYDTAFMFVGDEEHGGMSGANLLLEKAGYAPKLCIIPDAGDGFGSMSIAAKGTFHPTIRINGTSHHGSRPWEGDGAAGKLVRFISELEKAFDTTDQQQSTMTVSMLQAGDVINQGPAFANAKLDIRYKDQQDLKRIRTIFDRLLQKYQGEILELAIGSDFQLDTKNPQVSQFVELYKQAIGRDVRFIKAHGSSDARFFAEKNIPVIMFRPDGGGAHGDKEWLSIPSFKEFYHLLKRYVQESMVK